MPKYGSIILGTQHAASQYTLRHTITRYTAPLQEPLFITNNSDLKQQQT